MRLLAKQEIVVAQAKERENEIKEGVKIARRVDLLRELAAKEENEYVSFRRETLAKIHQEILELSQEKENVLGDVRVLREEKERGLTILCEKDKELKERERVLNEGIAELEKKEDEIKSLFRKANERTSESQKELIRAQTNTDEATRTRQIAESLMSEAQNILSQAKKSAQSALQISENREKQLNDREKWLNERESGLIEREKMALSAQEDVEKEKIRLADQRATLERAMQRIKHSQAI